MAGDKALGAKISAARAERGWRQKDLAAALGVEALTVSRWERGEHAPTVETVGRIRERAWQGAELLHASRDSAIAAGLSV